MEYDDGTDDAVDLLKHGAPLDTSILERVCVCECGRVVMFLDTGGYYVQEKHQRLEEPAPGSRQWPARQSR